MVFVLWEVGKVSVAEFDSTYLRVLSVSQQCLKKEEKRHL